jgi:hypothetical protein
MTTLNKDICYSNKLIYCIFLPRMEYPLMGSSSPAKIFPLISSASGVALRAKIRTRLAEIEKMLVRHLGEDRVQRLQESIHRRFNIDGKALGKSGITKPTLSAKNLFGDTQ